MVFIQQEKLNLVNKSLISLKNLNNISRWLRNKYLITGVGFIVWMFFIDRNDLLTQWKRIKEFRSLQQSEVNLNKQITEAKQELELLKTSSFTLEKYAREKYMMKKDNEDLYIVSK